MSERRLRRRRTDNRPIGTLDADGYTTATNYNLVGNVTQTVDERGKSTFFAYDNADEQTALPGAFTADFVVVRALWQKDRSYEQGVRLFEPYQQAREPDPSTRAALRQIAERALQVRQRAFVFVNTRLEGNTPATIEAVVSDLAASRGGGPPPRCLRKRVPCPLCIS